MSKVLSILQQVRPEFDFSASNDYFEDGLLDSFDLVTLVSELDSAYGISIEGTDILPENFSNLAAIEGLLVRNGVAL